MNRLDVHTDTEFLHSMGITLEETQEERRVPVITAAFYCAIFSVCFYGALWVLCAL